MYLSQAEENRNKAISLGTSLTVLALLILFFLLFPIITPNPPFPESADGGGGIQFNIGNLIEGTGNVQNDGIGEAPKVVESTEVTPAPKTPDHSTEEVVTSDVGEDVNLKKHDQSTSKPNNTTVVVPVKPKEKTAAELLAEKFHKNVGKNNGGGDGNSGQAGNEGQPDGKPDTHGNGGDGGGDGGEHGPGKGPSSGSNGNGKYGWDLKGRAIVSPPPLSKDTKEEGKVVVEIVVDKNGNVIKADPVGRGTNTNSIMLKAKARQAALATKFNVSGNFEEQKGTITIIFSF